MNGKIFFLGLLLLAASIFVYGHQVWVYVPSVDPFGRPYTERVIVQPYTTHGFLVALIGIVTACIGYVLPEKKSD